MRKHIYFMAAIVIATASAFTAFQTSDLKIADNYYIRFDGGDPAGEFRGLKGTIRFDPGNLAASEFNVSIDVATINTGNGMKNAHAKSAKWLDVEKYPEIRFTSSAITRTSDGFEAKGILDMHGVQKEITLPFTFKNNVFSSEIEVNRLDYNINTEEPKHGAAVLKVDISVPVTN